MGLAKQCDMGAFDQAIKKEWLTIGKNVAFKGAKLFDNRKKPVLTVIRRAIEYKRVR